MDQDVSCGKGSKKILTCIVTLDTEVGAEVGLVVGGAVAAGAGHPKYDGGDCDLAQLILVIKSVEDVLVPTPGFPSTHPFTPLHLEM
jgi:chorismate synthase